MAPHHEHGDGPILTASLTTGVARVARGMRESSRLIEDVLALDHPAWETTLLVGDVEFHQTAAGPYPDHQMIVSVRPSTGYAALNYTDNKDPGMPMANSYNPSPSLPNIYLISNGATGAVFPPTAAISIGDTRAALNEWLRTRQRPTCIEWRPYDV
jgi:hypothetical protein